MAKNSLVASGAYVNTSSWTSIRGIALVYICSVIVGDPVELVGVDNATSGAEGIGGTAIALLTFCVERIRVTDTESTPAVVR